MTEAQKRAKAKYHQKVKRLSIDFYPTEADLVEHIEKQPMKQTYIKDLIRADIENEKVCINIDGNAIATAVIKAYPDVFGK